jgi:hypothetical protein
MPYDLKTILSLSMTNLNHIETPKETPVCETVFNLMKELELCAPSTFDNLGKFNNA